MRKLNVLAILLVTIALLLTSLPIFSASAEWEYNEFTSSTTYEYKYIDGTESEIITEDHTLGYWLRKPDKYDPNKQYPIVVYVHGSDGCKYLSYKYIDHTDLKVTSSISDYDENDFLMSNIYGTKMYEMATSYEPGESYDFNALPASSTATMASQLMDCFVLYLQLPDELWWRNPGSNVLTIHNSSKLYADNDDVISIGKIEEESEKIAAYETCEHQINSIYYNEKNNCNYGYCTKCKKEIKTAAFKNHEHNFNDNDKVQSEKYTEYLEATCSICGSVHYFNKEHRESEVHSYSTINKLYENLYVKTCSLCHEDVLCDKTGKETSTIVHLPEEITEDSEGTFTYLINDSGNTYCFLYTGSNYILQYETKKNVDEDVNYYSATYSSTYLASKLDVNIYSQLLTALLDNILVDYSIDPTRQIISGFSVGATFAFDTISHYPDRFASAILIAPTTIDISQENCEKLSNMDIWLFNCRDDKRCNKYLSVKFCEAMNNVYNDVSTGSCQFSFFKKAEGTSGHNAALFNDSTLSIFHSNIYIGLTINETEKKSVRYTSSSDLLNYVANSVRKDMDVETYTESQKSFKDIEINILSIENEPQIKCTNGTYDVVLVGSANVKYTIDIGFVLEFSSLSGWYCQNCGGITQADTTPEYCPYCGQQIRKATLYCKDCKKYYYEDECSDLSCPSGNKKHTTQYLEYGNAIDSEKYRYVCRICGYEFETNSESCDKCQNSEHKIMFTQNFSNYKKYQLNRTVSCDCQSLQISVKDIDDKIQIINAPEGKYLFSTTLKNIPNAIDVTVYAYEVNSFGYNYSKKYKLVYNENDSVQKVTLKPIGGN